MKSAGSNVSCSLGYHSHEAEGHRHNDGSDWNVPVCGMVGCVCVRVCGVESVGMWWVVAMLLTLLLSSVYRVLSESECGLWLRMVLCRTVSLMWFIVRLGWLSSLLSLLDCMSIQCPNCPNSDGVGLAGA